MTLANPLWHELADPIGLIGHASYLLLILSMLMTNMRWLRVLAIGSGVLSVAYSLSIADYVSMGWEVVFVIVNLGQLAWQSWCNRRARFSGEEHLFRQTVIVGLEPALARRVINTGHWQDVPVGQTLITQGSLASHLYFLVQGQVAVDVDGTTVGHCGPGEMFGEISVLTGLEATASVRASAPCRCLALERGALRRLMQAESQVELAIDLACRADMRNKLASVNLALARSLGTA